MKHCGSVWVAGSAFRWFCRVSLVLLLLQCSAVMRDELMGALSTAPLRLPPLWLCLHSLMLVGVLISLRWPGAGVMLLVVLVAPFIARTGTSFFMPFYAFTFLPIILLLWLWVARGNSEMKAAGSAAVAEPKGQAPESKSVLWAKRGKRTVLPIIMLAVAAGCVGPEESLYPPGTGEPYKTVYVVDHGLHTAVVVERADILDHVWPANKDYAAFKYAEVGWGPDEIFQAPNLSVGLILKALFWPNRTVLLLDAYDGMPAQRSGPKDTVIEIKLSTNGFGRLCDYIQQTHALDAKGRPICLGRNFYQARGTYWAFNTCNNWTASALRRAGCPITPTYCFTSGPLFFQARRFGRVLSHQEETASPAAN
jgi:uncharacterized protein (TIGR02117 family)